MGDDFALNYNKVLISHFPKDLQWIRGFFVYLRPKACKNLLHFNN